MRRAVPGALGASVGVGVWTLTEYAAHRWVMHGRFARRNPLGAEHRAHHVDPAATSAPRRAAGYAALGVVVGGLAGMAGPGPGSVGAALGWFAGYAAYEQFHWREHHHPPLGGWERGARERHALHHAGRPRANFGVTTSFWDRVFGTLVLDPTGGSTGAEGPAGPDAWGTSGTSDGSERWPVCRGGVILRAA